LSSDKVRLASHFLRAELDIPFYQLPWLIRRWPVRRQRPYRFLFCHIGSDFLSVKFVVASLVILSTTEWPIVAKVIHAERVGVGLDIVQGSKTIVIKSILSALVQA
jgi:hypothetical protein